MSWNIEKPGDRINGPVTITGNTTLTGAATISGDLTVDTSTLKVDSTNNRLGIGTATPDSALQISGAGTINWKLSNTANSVTVGSYAGTSAGTIGTVSNHDFFLYTNNTERLRIDSSGNLGLGVTPSAWGSGGKAFDITTTGSLEGIGGNSVSISYNRYYNGSNYYKTNGPSGIFSINIGGNHVWYTAPAGTAGNAISGANAYVQMMTLDASGNLGVGTSTPAYKLDVSGSFNAQSGRIYNSSATKFDIVNTTSSLTYSLYSANSASNGFDGFGIYFPNTNTLALAVGGSDAVYIDANRNVGIGTPTPQYRTQITSTSNNAVTNALALHNGSNAAGTGTGVRLLFKLANFQDAVENRKYASIEGISTSSFNESIDLVFKTQQSAASGDVSERLRIKSTGQLNFTGLAADPASATAGDVYYNSSTNKLRCYNGTTWNDLF